MNNAFYFGILAYNQEKEIVFTLNSIKYQITKYGALYDCTLVITDDCSKDNTVERVECWLNNNSHLFKRIIRRYNKENKGIVDNYNYILDQISCEPFKIIAGDDIISENNIFDLFKKVGNHTIYNGLRFFFNEEKGVFFCNRYAYLHFYLMNKKLSRKQLYKVFRMGNLISTPQTLYSKQLYNDSKAKYFNCNYRLFEDNPTWYSMFKNVGDLNVLFDMNNLVLYRISEKSVSNGATLKRSFKYELDCLYNVYLKDSDFWEKLYFKSIINSLPSFINFSKYANKWFFFKCYVYSLFHYHNFEQFKKQIEKQLKISKDYYREISFYSRG